MDAGDLALALPFPLRRIGLTTILLPRLVGRPRLFASEALTPVRALATWLMVLDWQAMGRA